jgi:hypothetical protein
MSVGELERERERTHGGFSHSRRGTSSSHLASKSGLRLDKGVGEESGGARREEGKTGERREGARGGGREGGAGGGGEEAGGEHSLGMSEV